MRLVSRPLLPLADDHVWVCSDDLHSFLLDGDGRSLSTGPVCSPRTCTDRSFATARQTPAGLAEGVALREAEGLACLDVVHEDGTDGALSGEAAVLQSEAEPVVVLRPVGLGQSAEAVRIGYFDGLALDDLFVWCGRPSARMVVSW